MPNTDDFRRAIAEKLREAESAGLNELAINSGDLHRDVGGYPGPQHRMPLCCDAMYDVRGADDRIIQAPPSGKGASLSIAYRLPRKRDQISARYDEPATLNTSQRHAMHTADGGRADYNNFQRLGFAHNAGIGSHFEAIARQFFLKHEGLDLVPNLSLPIGVGEKRKPHRFDLGCLEPSTIVECKSHTWTQGGRMPSAKMTVWNEAMYYFYLAPPTFRKIMFVLKHNRAGNSLAAYYLKTHGHLVPQGVEFWEFDTDTNSGERLEVG